VAGVSGPVLGIFKDAEEVTLRHAGADFLFKLNQPGGSLGRCQLLQMRGAVGIDAQFGIGRETGVNCSGKRRQFSFQRGGKILPSFGNTASGTVGR
jgi:hypothetical protein